ncbi:unnamed protein product, partial [Amoebophrya sp. A25]
KDHSKYDSGTRIMSEDVFVRQAGASDYDSSTPGSSKQPMEAMKLEEDDAGFLDFALAGDGQGDSMRVSAVRSMQSQGWNSSEAQDSMHGSINRVLQAQSSEESNVESARGNGQQQTFQYYKEPAGLVAPPPEAFRKTARSVRFDARPEVNNAA